MLYFIFAGIFACAAILFALRALKYRLLLNRTLEMYTKVRDLADENHTEDIGKLMENLARQHGNLTRLKYSKLLLKKNWKNWHNIKLNYRHVINVPERILSVVPSAQWLIDNWYVINRETRVIREIFSMKSLKELPCLKDGLFEGYPRVYHIAWHIVRATNMHLDEDNIVSLVNAYQAVKPISIAELWALPNMLKISLIDAINDICCSIVDNIKVKQKTDRIIEEVLGKPWSNIEDVMQRLIYKMEQNGILNFNCLVQVLYRLKEFDVDENFFKQCVLSTRCGENFDVAEAIRVEAGNQAMLQVKISSAITSLIQVSGIDWEKLFEKISIVESILSKDPSGVYPKMDFATRDTYHREIAALAKKLGVEEREVAQRAILLGQDAVEKGEGDALSHVGYYIIAKGRSLLEKSFSYKPGIFKRTAAWLGIGPGTVYFLGVFIIAALVYTLTLLFPVNRISGASWPVIALMAFFMAVISMTIALEIMNSLFTRCLKPRKLPSMDFEKGIPDQFRTIVVMPVITESKEQIRRYIQNLESYYLANRDKNLFFAILADLKDANSQETPIDGEIIKEGVECTESLNMKYTGSKNGPFYFLLRKRKWNENELCWMGWERKRGKLEEFNCLLLGSENTSYNVVAGDISIFPTIKYVITIDADTELAKGSASKMIGIMAHPLNRPVLNPDNTKVIDGYGVLQPRIGIRANFVYATLFSRIFAGQAGIDPYTNAISDIYQDAFGQGTFAGKGIYDLRVFQRVLTGTIPENTVLSHDLLEGCYARCALATEIELMDGYPSTVISYFSREHRWIRGDWQLLPWLLGRDSLSGLSKWKIFDNLRRSLVGISQFGLVLLALLVMGWSSEVWIFLVFFNMFFALIMNIPKNLVSWIRGAGCGSNTFGVLSNLLTALVQGIILFLLIPYRAYISADAIIRVLYRMFISHKKMLEWRTAESVERSVSNNLNTYIRKMWVGPLAGILILLFAPGETRLVAFSTAVIWILSPLVSYFASLPYKTAARPVLDYSETSEIRCVARKTWRYFDEFFTEQDNWLTPDNYQVYPGDVLARRTSPTNMGMQLLSTLSARDLGYIGLNHFIDRLVKFFSTLARMEQWHGNLYNWYDTRTLEILYPHYVSTVDSANFIASLIVLKNALEELKGRPVFGRAQYEGLVDTARLGNISINFSVPGSGKEWKLRLEELKDNISSGETDLHGDEWDSMLLRQCKDFIDDIELFGIGDVEEPVPSLATLGKENNPAAKELLDKIDYLMADIEKRVVQTNFRPLYDKNRGLFRVGFNVSLNVPDNSYYDLLASESRLASFIAIAKGDVPEKHWFKLARPLTIVRGKAVLISWSGTMFEYLLPNLVMKVFPGTLLEQTSKMAVRAQIDYGRRKKVPWGISESAYYRFDQMLNYQYRAFGVPNLGFKSDLRKSLVVAPYAALLAMSVDPKEVYSNIKQLKKYGAYGDYGFYEAIDFISPVIQDSRRKYKLIQCYMIHHQGMSLVALNNYLNNNIMQLRFHREPMVRGTELLLEERRPCGIVIKNEDEVLAPPVTGRLFRKKRESRIIKTTKLKYPVAHLLSNSRYTLMITSNGNGISSWNDIAVNRWRSSVNSDSWGIFFYIRNTRNKKYWSATYLPTYVEPDSYMAVFSPDKAEFRRMDGHIETRTEIVVSPTEDIEIRQITLTNRGLEQAMIEVTSYFEPVIDVYEADLSHPAFSKLFVTTEYIESKNMLIATRRPRKEGEKKRHVFNFVVVKGKSIGEIEYETDRNFFIGRGNSLRMPQVLKNDIPLSGTVGSVLDPIMSLRVNVMIAPGRSAAIIHVIGATDMKEKAIELCNRYQNTHLVGDVFKMAFIDSEVEMQYLGLTARQVNAIQDIVGSIYYFSKIMRAPGEIIKNNRMGQPGLWKFGISGDYPIMMFRIKDINHINTLKETVLAYEYLRKNGMKLDFIILNEEDEDYFQPLGQQISSIVTNRRIYYPNVKNSGIFILKARNLSKEELYLLMTVSRVIISENNPIMARKIEKMLMEEIPVYTMKNRPVITRRYEDISLPEEELIQFNGLGGFTPDGREYVTILKGEYNTPAPWVNIIANDSFGFIVSTSGTGYTWAVNSRENKITSWSNDPVVDPPSEIIYIRDEATWEVFSPTPSPIRGKEPYKIRHGFGYSVFEHGSHGIMQNMTVYASSRDPVKIYKLKLENRLPEDRKLSVFFYVEWTMGVSRETTAPYIVTHMDEESNILTAINTYNDEFKDRVAFISSNGRISSYTADRLDFLGASYDFSNPQGLMKSNLPGNVGHGLDPCGVIKVNIKLSAKQKKELVFVLGEAADYDTAILLAETYRHLQVADIALDKVKLYWKRLLSQIQVETPDKAFDIMLNGWLLYQVLSCRYKARSAFYQSSGAYGFRDQLQDVMALIHASPGICREHIIRCCSRQFVEGDVQHWWHNDSGKGIRTKISDDLLWLPFVTAMYVNISGDEKLLDEIVPYLEGEDLEPDKAEKYFKPVVSQEKGSVYEHCVRAIERAMRFGKAGLPLIGSGDWNDSMNLVGCGGNGQSVWLAWFLYKVLKDFIPLCMLKGDKEKASFYEEVAEKLRDAVEKNAWDGEWYLRAYFDNGIALGSRLSMECKIDSIPQSWAVISGGASRERALLSMESVKKYLVKEEDQLVLLLTPPFDKFQPDPGYIRSYLPGIRENGGQYTHAAVWNVIAFAKIGNGDAAYEIYKMLNPINHTGSYPEVMKYKLEPYVMSADIYSKFPHAGRGGWSWYTGSAGWMYQAGIQWILGIWRKGERLYIKPVIPLAWGQYTVTYRYGKTKYIIEVRNPKRINTGNVSMNLDGKDVSGEGILLADDGIEHRVVAVINPAPN